MNNDYGQQFMQSLRNPPASQPTGGGENSGGSKIPLVISVVLAVVLLFETIALIIMNTNFTTAMSKISTTESKSEIDEENEGEDYGANFESNYIYDDSDNLVAIKLECKSEDGSKYILSNDKTYKSSIANGQTASTGTYTINRSSVISLKSTTQGNSKTIFYDGSIIVDGSTIYDCEEDLDETEGTN